MQIFSANIFPKLPHRSAKAIIINAIISQCIYFSCCNELVV